MDTTCYVLYHVRMFIAVVPNRRSRPTTLLRESYRVGKAVKSRTLANLSKLPPEAIEVLRRTLRGESLVSPEDAFDVLRSYHHGHVQAVMDTMCRLEMPKLLASQHSRERNLVLALVAARILYPSSKIATTRSWGVSSLPSMFDVADATEDDLYQAMDWLVERQDAIEKKLATRHLQDGALALYDLTSSYFEGVTCPLAKLGHNRDGKKGKLQVNYGLLTDHRGCPVSVSVFDGNTGDPKTLLPQVEKARDRFGVNHLVLVGDRGMITQKQVDSLKTIEGMDWISALRPEAIRKLVHGGAIQMGLFDECNLFELSHPDFPNERLVVCRNPDLARMRAHKRSSLVEATTKELEKVRLMVEGGRILGSDQIGSRIHSILKRYAIGSHYKVVVRDDGFDAEPDTDALASMVAAAAPGFADKRRDMYSRHRQAVASQLEKLRHRIGRGRLFGKDKIGIRVGKVLDKYQVGKHFTLQIEDNSFFFEVNHDKVTAEAALDGLYVVRTSVPQQRMDSAETVRSYKLLAQVERAFRCLKSIDLKVRPIFHHLENRVRAHILLCMLAYYVEWHMLEAWRPLLFSDEDLDAKNTRDPVAPARRSDAALKKVSSKRLDDGSPAHSFQTLLTDLTSIVRNVCVVKGAPPDTPSFEIITLPSPLQQRAFSLLQTITL
jgi:hypothetical protein